MNGAFSPSDDHPREQLNRAKAFLRRAMLFWRSLAWTVLFGGLICMAYLYFKPPHFRSQIVLLYSDPIRASEGGDPVATPKSLAVRMQEMLTARHKLQQVVEAFDLYPDVRRNDGMSEAVDEFKKHIEFRAPGGDTFTIAFEGNSPEQARDVTARLADLVIGQDAELRKQQATAQRDFLSVEKKRAAERLRHAEQELATFMSEHPRFALDATPLATGAAIRASVGQPVKSTSPRTRLVAVPSKAVPDKSATGAVAAPLAEAPSADELNKQHETLAEIGRARAALAAARGDLTDKLTRYTDAHPDVRDAREAVRRAEVRVDSLAREVKPVSSTPSPAVGKEAPTSAADTGPRDKPRYVQVPVPGRSAGAESEPKPENVVTLETDWSRLTLAVTEARQRHDQIESSLFKADIASSSASLAQSARVSVIDPAFLPQRPVPPGPRMIALLFLGFSLVGGVLIAFGRTALDDRVFDERGTAGLIDVLVEIPSPSKERKPHA